MKRTMFTTRRKWKHAKYLLSPANTLHRVNILRYSYHQNQ
ncbi:hypothetical protein G1C97_2370 [Bifidobacterium sp. DSM 109959]|uniref:Uncharacterized protein n=1 Tax=Bifidobacterium olomucense TaxID=2675324 RepID=A0A7Y0EZT9_9BIFI|nr:hypothetical protein [Bifidobacterium sp. DSM 109959]